MATIIDNPASDPVQAMFVRLHCRAMAKGMSHSKMSKSDVLKKAGAITGKTYKRGQHALAAEDLTKIIEEGKSNG